MTTTQPKDTRPCTICHEPVDCDDPDVHSELIRLRGVIAEIARKLDGCISDHPEMPLSQAMAHVFLDIRAIIQREKSGASSPQA